MLRRAVLRAAAVRWTRSARAPIAATVLATALLATACSGGSAAPKTSAQPGTGTASAGAGGVQQIIVRTGADLRFHPSTLVVHPGRVRIVLENQGSGSPPHDLQVTGLPGAFVPLTPSGEVGTITFTAGAVGRYPLECTIHAAQGQTGMLVVEAAH